MKTAIVIPARWGSSRLPGKPLVLIAGRTLLSRVVGVARQAATAALEARVVVATDDERIGRHCEELGVSWLMTPADCRTGTDRVESAVRQLKDPADFVVNLQGDAPLTPPEVVRALIRSYQAAPTDIVTPVTRLGWADLDTLRESKKAAPFSGTCAAFNPETGAAYWFSKNIIPALRDEKKLRQGSDLSPVYQHLGLYGYNRGTLAKFVALPEGAFEKLEGLEQLRALENGFTIRCVPVEGRGAGFSGVDSPEDVARAEALIAKIGEP